MRQKILYISAFIFCLLSVQPICAQEASASSGAPQTIKIDAFGQIGECELGARVQAFWINLSQMPNSKGYIVTYRGADDLFVNQTDAFLQKIWTRIRMQMAFLKLDASRITFKDGGFRKTSSFENELWIADEGASEPAISDTVAKPKTPKDKAYKADERWMYIEEAQIRTEEEIAETNVVEEEMTETEPTEESAAVEETPVKEVSEEPMEIEEEIEEYDWISNFFVETLQADRKTRGVLIYYADDAEFEIPKALLFIDNELRARFQKEQIDMSRVKVVFGGYREDPRMEFWIVPDKAKDPIPTPQERKAQ